MKTTKWKKNPDKKSLIFRSAWSMDWIILLLSGIVQTILATRVLKKVLDACMIDSNFRRPCLCQIVATNEEGFGPKVGRINACTSELVLFCWVWTLKELLALTTLKSGDHIGSLVCNDINWYKFFKRLAPSWATEFYETVLQRRSDQ